MITLFLHFISGRCNSQNTRLFMALKMQQQTVSPQQLLQPLLLLDFCVNFFSQPGHTNCQISRDRDEVGLNTLNSWTPIQAKMNSSRNVTRKILQIVFTATITHCTTCCKQDNSTTYYIRDCVCVCVHQLINSKKDFLY